MQFNLIAPNISVSSLPSKRQIPSNSTITRFTNELRVISLLKAAIHLIESNSATLDFDAGTNESKHIQDKQIQAECGEKNMSIAQIAGGKGFIMQHTSTTSFFCGQGSAHKFR